MDIMMDVAVIFIFDFFFQVIFWGLWFRRGSSWFYYHDVYTNSPRLQKQSSRTSRWQIATSGPTWTRVEQHYFEFSVRDYQVRDTQLMLIWFVNSCQRVNIVVVQGGVNCYLLVNRSWYEILIFDGHGIRVILARLFGLLKSLIGSSSSTKIQSPINAQFLHLRFDVIIAYGLSNLG